MGQRHQLFAVAKVASRYRVLAAIHHQWLYAESVVDRALQILKLFQSNAPLLRQDLQYANQVDWQSIKPSPQRSMKQWRAMTSEEHIEERKTRLAIESQFPIITTCLMVGTAKGEDGYSRVHPLPVTTSLKDCDNNDGYSVFDITDPEHLRYCFVLGEDSQSMAYGDTDYVQPMTPIGPREYLACYVAERDNVPSDEEEEARHDSDDSRWNSRVTRAYMELEMDPDVDEMRQYLLIDANTLAEVWPMEKFRTSQAVPGAPGPEEGGATRGAASITQQSLRSTAMSEVISQALEDERGDLSWLQDAEQLADFAHLALSHLSTAPNAIRTTGGFNLLCRALQGRQNIDLSMFHQMEPEQLLRVVSTLQDSSSRIKLTLPCLDLTPEQVHQVAHTGNIVELHLGATKRLDLGSLIEAASGAQLESISHPEIYKTALVAASQIPEDLSQLATDSIRRVLHGDSMCQAIWIATTRFNVAKDQVPRLSSGAFAWAQYFANFTTPSDLDHFSAINNFLLPDDHIVPIPLHDAPTSIRGLLPRLYNTFGAAVLGANTSNMSYSALGSLLAMSLSFNDGGQIAPLPAALFASYQQKGRSTCEPTPLVKPIVQGEWTMLVCQERDMDQKSFSVRSSTVHHCFVTRGEDGRLICRTLEEFLNLLPPSQGEQTCPISASELSARLQRIPTNGTWTDQTELTVGDCDLEEAEEAIKATEMFNEHNETWMKGLGGAKLAAFRRSRF
ncbi:hypothetical protein CERZMDRAFT_106795 [Cercospora zeae-maydis SCOH1-5]|uniref:Uncharacterized protein n=1 Tax=Cercospora zeae-maydis SCOH1-5 TaxID=717836 RepID=A0A6A6FAC4_9PEZI|nr:hypothetical protein CERZMDRAFT_106795 [Cercospora zeae-maydis SCOH1-5]